MGGACGLPSREAEVNHTKNTVLNIATALERLNRSSDWGSILSNLQNAVFQQNSSGAWHDELTRVVQRILVDVFPPGAQLEIKHPQGHFFVHSPRDTLPDPPTLLCRSTHSHHLKCHPVVANVLAFSGCFAQQTVGKITQQKAGVCGRFLTYLANFCAR